MPLSDELIVRMLQARWKPECWICHGTEWRVFGSNGDPLTDEGVRRVVLGDSWPDGTPIDDRGISVIACACVRCGNVRLIAPEAIGSEMDDGVSDAGQE